MAGLYVACWLPAAQAHQLALDGGEPPEKLHVTLVCLSDGDGDENLPANVTELAAQAIATVCADQPPLLGSVDGLGVFQQDDCQVLVGLVDVLGLNELRQRLLEELCELGVEPDDDHDFSPHVTLAYLEPDTQIDAGGWQPLPITLDSLALLGDDVVRDACPFAAVAKEGAQGVRPDLHLQVVGVHRAPDDANLFVYRTGSGDGHYVGRTLATRLRAAKGDVITVAPHTLELDGQGDLVWTEPRVMTRWDGRADSLRALRALAAEAVVKDEPSSSDVHVDVPLGSDSPRKKKKRKKTDPAISVAYKVAKIDEEQQLVYGVVLEPHMVDSQGDWETPADITEAAHRYLTKGWGEPGAEMGQQHQAMLAKAQIVPVESFIAPADFAYPENPGELISKGSWVLVAKINDPVLWGQVKAGLFTGWSVAGTGVRDLSQPTPDVAKQAPWFQPVGILERLVAAFEGMAGRPDEGTPDVHVHVPEQPAPVVNVAAPEWPELPAPVVNVHVPEQPAPVVNVAAAEAPVVHVEQARPRAVRVEELPGGGKRFVPEGD